MQPTSATRGFFALVMLILHVASVANAELLPWRRGGGGVFNRGYSSGPSYNSCPNGNCGTPMYPGGGCINGSCRGPSSCPNGNCGQPIGGLQQYPGYSASPGYTQPNSYANYQQPGCTSCGQPGCKCGPSCTGPGCQCQGPGCAPPPYYAANLNPQPEQLAQPFYPSIQPSAPPLSPDAVQPIGGHSSGPVPNLDSAPGDRPEGEWNPYRIALERYANKRDTTLEGAFGDKSTKIFSDVVCQQKVGNTTTSDPRVYSLGLRRRGEEVKLVFHQKSGGAEAIPEQEFETGSIPVNLGSDPAVPGAQAFVGQMAGGDITFGVKLLGANNDRLALHLTRKSKDETWVCEDKVAGGAPQEVKPLEEVKPVEEMVDVIDCITKPGKCIPRQVPKSEAWKYAKGADGAPLYPQQPPAPAPRPPQPPPVPPQPQRFSLREVSTLSVAELVGRNFTGTVIMSPSQGDCFYCRKLETLYKGKTFSREAIKALLTPQQGHAVLNELKRMGRVSPNQDVLWPMTLYFQNGVPTFVDGYHPDIAQRMYAL